MDELHDFKPGNYFVYYGLLQRYNGQIGQIVEENEMSHDNRNFTSHISEPWLEKVDVITAYANEIRGVEVSKEFFEKNGFISHEDGKYFSKNEVKIFRIAYSKPDENSPIPNAAILHDLGWRVLTGRITNLKDEKHVMENSMSVHFIHCLQNYYEFILGQSGEIIL